MSQRIPLVLISGQFYELPAGDSIAGAASAAALTQTGATLFQRDLDISGALVAQIVGGNGTQVKVSGSSALLSVNITGIGGTVALLSGNTLFISGGIGGGDVTAAQLASTGQQAWLAANNNGLNLSGALTQSGVQLGAKIDSLSGWAASAANLQSTGSSLYSFVTNMSGQAITDYATKTALANTGQQAWIAADTNARIISGNLTQTGVQLAATAAATYATIANLALTGQQAWSAANNNGINLSGNLTQTGVQLAATAAATYATIANLQSTGSSLYALTTAFSGQADTNYATKISLAATGQQAWLAADNNGRALSGNLTQTGVQLAATAAATYATIANLAATGQSLFILVTGLSGQSVTDYATKVSLANTGQQAWSAANNNAINLSGNLTSYATTANLQSTGQSLYGLITAASGQADTNYATKISLAATGQQAWTAANTNAVIISGNLTQTGVQLAATAASTYATLANVTLTGQSLGTRIDTVTTNLGTTGQALYNLTTAFSGQADTNYATKAALANTGQQAWTAATNNGINLSGNLTQTGISLIQRDINISGALQLQINSGLMLFNRQVASYTTTSGDWGQWIQMDVATANVLTVTALSGVNFATGVQIIIEQLGAGLTTVSPGVGVTIHSRGAALKMGGQYAVAALVQTSGNCWNLAGDITT